MANWLLKTEPDEFSLDDLEAKGAEGEPWNGIRNYQARNFLKQMQPGDRVLIYHSSCAVPGVVGEAEVIGEPYPDPDALNPSSKYFDPKSSTEQTRWWVVMVRFKRRWSQTVSLKTLKQQPGLDAMALLRQSRLSVSPVTDKEWEIISSIA